MSRDALERLSYLFGIYKALQILLPKPESADAWVHRPNKATPFQGQSALDRMLSTYEAKTGPEGPAARSIRGKRNPSDPSAAAGANEFRIGLESAFADIDTFVLFLLAHADAHDQFDQQPNDD